MPGVGFWDTAEFQAVPPLLGTLHPTGFPAYAILGWLGVGRSSSRSGRRPTG